MSMWDPIDPRRIAPAKPAAPGELAHGMRVARVGTVSFVRSGFARVQWDDGRTTDEWAADLVRTDHDPVTPE
jgi:hypothetical protein